jgi:uncharacterized protein
MEPVKNANPVSFLLRLAGPWMLCLLLAGCGAEAAAPAASQGPGAWFEVGVGTQTVRLQLAVTPAEMQRGLMGRRDLVAGQGMLFLYDRPQRMSFWMRNTPTPLDIGFFDAAGVLREVYPLYPFDERSVKSRGEALQFALEVPQGWFGQAGVRPGARLDLKAVSEALKARGFDPGRWITVP